MQAAIARSNHEPNPSKTGKAYRHFAVVADKVGFNSTPVSRNSIKARNCHAEQDVLRKLSPGKYDSLFVGRLASDFNEENLRFGNSKPCVECVDRIKNAKIDYAIHIDTGINRLGIPSKDVKMLDLKNKNIKLVISHLSSSDEYKIKYNIKQKELFNTFVNKKPKGVIFSLANAHGSILDKTYLYDMIRPGIGIYGCYENKQLENKIKNVINFKGKIIQIKDLQKNQYIGYNRTFKTKTKTKVAIIGLGYEDGIPRSLSNKGFVYFKKDRFKIIGRISMDSFTIDISKCSHDLKVGMYVDIINEEHKVDKFAKKCKTISYEVLTSIGNRVYRNYE